MKRGIYLKRTVFCLLFFLVLCSAGMLILTACGNDGIVGRWELTECIVNGEALTDMNPCEFLFYEDSTGEKKISGETEFTFSYSYDGTTCILYNIIYADGTPDESGTYSEMNIKGNRMIIDAYENGVDEHVIFQRK